MNYVNIENNPFDISDHFTDIIGARTESKSSMSLATKVDAMSKIVLEDQGQQITASVTSGTHEVTFDGKAVTGKMWLVQPGRRYVEIVQRGGKYYLESAA